MTEAVRPDLIARPPTPEGESPPALTLVEVRKDFGAVAAVAGVSLTVQSGEFVTLLGPSGCGKSTLLRMVAGIETPSAGRIGIAGKTVSDTARHLLVPPERRGLGLVFQSYAIWPHMTVAQNVEYPLRYAGVAKRDRGPMVVEALSAVSLDGLAARFPAQLSGGQQQRVALARAIVARPALLLLDEPLSNLDARLRENMRVELKRLQVELKLTALYVTHDQSEALAMSDRILVMNAGHVLQEGTPEHVYRDPDSLTVAQFLGVKNILDGTLVDNDCVRLGPYVVPARVRDAGLHDGNPVRVAIRPDAFAPSTNGAGMEGRIDLVEFLGSGYEYQVTLGEAVSVVMYSRENLGVRGDAVCLTVEPGAVVAFLRNDP
jgi:ABC-type Fe3+/spermidine/putrescine transport system ATPase subunit